MERDAERLGLKLRDVATHVLDLLHHKFLAGDHWALSEAINECCTAGLPLPDWASDAYREAFARLANLEVASWDNLLGFPDTDRKHVNGKRAAQAREDARKSQDIYKRIKNRAPDESISDNLFDKVGKEFGVSKSTCNRLYYEQERLERLVQDWMEGSEGNALNQLLRKS